MNKYKIINAQTDEIIDVINVRNIYEDSFYHCPMPTIGKRKCSEILKRIYPHFKADGVYVIIEEQKTGHRTYQKLFRDGTIIV